MRRVNVVLLVSALAIVCAGPAIAEPDALSGDAIRAAVSGATASGTTNSGKAYHVRYLDDGTTRLSMDDNSFIDRGKWMVEGDRFCGQWNKIRKGAKGCWYLIHQQGDRYLFKGIDGMADIDARLSK